MKKIIILTIVLMLIFLLPLGSFQINAMVELEKTEEVTDLMSDSDDNVSVASVPGGEDTHNESWYGLLVDNDCIPLIYQEINYSAKSELLKYLKPGDIIYETNGSPLGDVTKHIAIVYDIVYDDANDQEYVMIIEAYTGGVLYGIMTPNRFEEKDVIIYRLTNASETQIQGALTWIKSQLGSTYRIPWNKYLNGVYDEENGTNSFYCAELVWAAFYRQGIYLDWDDNNDGGSIISPFALASYEHLTTILHYTDYEDEERYKTTITNNGATGHTYSCDGDTYTEEHDYEVYNYCYEKCRACGYQRQAKEHNYSYTTASSSVHEATCTDCGYTETKSHNFVCDGVENYLHYEKCTDCGYRANRMSDYQYVNINSTQHTSECTTCGHTSMGEHKWGYQTINNTSHRKYCTLCGYISGTESHIVDPTYIDPTDKYKKCKYCKGLYTSGIITPIIKNKIEIEEETE